MRINERIDQLYKLSKVYAKAKSEEDFLKHWRKSQLAILKSEFAEVNPKWSNVKCEDAARGCARYKTVLDGLREATRIAAESLWTLRIANAGIGLYQTAEATKRAEMQNLHRDI